MGDESSAILESFQAGVGAKLNPIWLPVLLVGVVMSTGGRAGSWPTPNSFCSATRSKSSGLPCRNLGFASDIGKASGVYSAIPMLVTVSFSLAFLSLDFRLRDFRLSDSLEINCQPNVPRQQTVPGLRQAIVVVEVELERGPVERRHLGGRGSQRQHIFERAPGGRLRAQGSAVRRANHPVPHRRVGDHLRPDVRLYLGDARDRQPSGKREAAKLNPEDVGWAEPAALAKHPAGISGGNRARNRVGEPAVRVHTRSG